MRMGPLLQSKTLLTPNSKRNLSGSKPLDLNMSPELRKLLREAETGNVERVRAEAVPGTGSP